MTIKFNYAFKRADLETADNYYDTALEAQIAAENDFEDMMAEEGEYGHFNESVYIGCVNVDREYELVSHKLVPFHAYVERIKSDFEEHFSQRDYL